MKYTHTKSIVGILTLSFLLPVTVFAEESFEISAWIPYWRTEKGIESITPHLDTFSEVNPFVYTVKENGTLNQADSLSNPSWRTLQAQAKQQGIRYIPTVMWAGTESIHRVLSDPAQRKLHIQSIAGEVFRYGFDGIDIDYEAKYAKTRPYFSLFLKELDEAIGYNKWIMCTIESRTPLDSRYPDPSKIPTDIEYSNDFVEINKYCDRVRMMAYDQGRFDQKLNAENEHPYTPVADTQWVEKVMRLAAKDIDLDKLMIGIPTYGYEYDHWDNPSGTKGYAKLWSFNPGYATEIAERLNLTIERSGGGEAQFIFPANQSLESIPLPNATRIVTWSDAEAIRQKVELARDLGLRGVAIFKIDGGEDQGIWNVITPYAGTHVTAVKPPDVLLAQRALREQGVISTPPSLPNVVTHAVPTIDLEKNNISESVRTLQKILNEVGYTVAENGPGSKGNETNVFGSLTEKALIRFQKDYNIVPAIGYFGPITRAKMNNL